MSRTVKDFDDACKNGNYIVKVDVGEGLPAVTVYDNTTGSDAEYYSVYAKEILKIRQRKNGYILYI